MENRYKQPDFQRLDSVRFFTIKPASIVTGYVDAFEWHDGEWHYTIACYSVKHLSIPESKLELVNRHTPSKSPNLKTPKEAHNAAVKDILTQRGDQYTPDPARSQIQAEMNDTVMAALKPLLPDNMPLGSQFILTQMVGKLTRAIEGALNGRYEGDNGLDLSGYEACLCAKKRGVLPQEVVK